MTLCNRLARPEIVALTPYSSARREHQGGTLFLNANESPWNNSSVDNLNRYPDCQPSQLRQQYAAYAGVAPAQVLITRGADEGIDLLIRGFCRPSQDAVGCLTPSYGMYAISAATNAVCCESIPWTRDYQLPRDFAERNQSNKLVFVCNPNNPTGTVIAPHTIAQLATQLPDSLLVVDEAYIEFSPSLSAISLLAAHPNLVILRTLSKAFGLAGARCGFVLASSDIIALLEKVIAPYPVPEPVSQLACLATNANGLALMRQQVQQLNQLREQFCDGLSQLSCVKCLLPSNANFVLFQCHNSQQAEHLYQGLIQQGILIRRYQQAALSGWLRVSVGDAQQMDTLMQQLTQLNAEASQLHATRKEYS